MRTINLLSLGLTLFIFSCSPKVKQTVNNSIPPLKDFENLIVFSKIDSNVLKRGSFVGDIVIKDSGLTLNCDLETVIEAAKEKARSLGANVLMIYEQKPPNIIISTCHRIRAMAIRLDNISEYESEIIWHKDRKLKMRDFKGEIESRPFLASTVASFKYSAYLVKHRKQAIITAQTVFFCKNSYFKIQDDSLSVLSHEQLHFDITELYTRDFIKQIKESSFTINNIKSEIERIANETALKLQIENDRYDTEVISDSTKQSYWKEDIKKRLEQSSGFEQKRVVIPYKVK